MMMKWSSVREWDVDVDRPINPYLPRNQLHRLPLPVSWFLGYRRTPQPPLGNVWIFFWSFLGAFLSLVLIAAVTRYSPLLQEHHPPIIFASFGAAAVIEFNTIDSPLAQPRNCLVGHGLSAIIGVSITKLFLLRSDFEDIRWIAGAVACGAASSAMLLTKTIHPPGGATALLTAVLPVVTQLGWFFVPMIILDSLLMLLTAMVVNNIQRRWPVFWWTPNETGMKYSHKKQKDIEKGASRSDSDESEGSGKKRVGRKLSRLSTSEHHEQVPRIIVTPDQIVIPFDLQLDEEDVAAIEDVQRRLAVRAASWASEEGEGLHREDTAVNEDGRV